MPAGLRAEAAEGRDLGLMRQHLPHEGERQVLRRRRSKVPASERGILPVEGEEGRDLPRHLLLAGPRHQARAAGCGASRSGIACLRPPAGRRLQAVARLTQPGQGGAGGVRLPAEGGAQRRDVDAVLAREQFDQPEVVSHTNGPKD